MMLASHTHTHTHTHMHTHMHTHIHTNTHTHTHSSKRIPQKDNSLCAKFARVPRARAVDVMAMWLTLLRSD